MPPGEDESEVQHAGGQRRLGEDVQPEEARRSVEVHGGEEEERSSTRPLRAAAESGRSTNGVSAASEHEPVQQKQSVQQKPVAFLETLVATATVCSVPFRGGDTYRRPWACAATMARPRRVDRWPSTANTSLW